MTTMKIGYDKMNENISFNRKKTKKTMYFKPSTQIFRHTHTQDHDDDDEDNSKIDFIIIIWTKNGKYRIFNTKKRKTENK